MGTVRAQEQRKFDCTADGAEPSLARSPVTCVCGGSNLDAQCANLPNSQTLTKSAPEQERKAKATSNNVAQSERSPTPSPSCQSPAFSCTSAANRSSLSGIHGSLQFNAVCFPMIRLPAWFMRREAPCGGLAPAPAATGEREGESTRTCLKSIGGRSPEIRAPHLWILALFEEKTTRKYQLGPEGSGKAPKRLGPKPARRSRHGHSRCRRPLALGRRGPSPRPQRPRGPLGR